MNKKVVKILMLLLVVNMTFTANSASRKNSKELKTPAQIKPERMKLLEGIANRILVDKELPFTKETADIMKKMLEDKDDFINDPIVDIERMSRSIEVPMGVNDGAYKKIYFSPNASTTLVFVDKLGNPWTIEKHTVSTPSKVHPELVKSNMMTFSPKVNRGLGDMTLFFKGSNFPITLLWDISTEKVDHITEIRLNGYGNQSPKDNMIRHYVGGNSVTPKYQQNDFSLMISGNTPYGYNMKDVVNEFNEIEEGFKVWVSADGQNIYTRTTHKVFYPPVISTKKSADKHTKVYKTKFAPRITVKKDGKLLHLKIKNK
jgi:hypothetical protein